MPSRQQVFGASSLILVTLCRRTKIEHVAVTPEELLHDATPPNQTQTCHINAAVWVGVASHQCTGQWMACVEFMHIALFLIWYRCKHISSCTGFDFQILAAWREFTKFFIDCFVFHAKQLDLCVLNCSKLCTHACIFDADSELSLNCSLSVFFWFGDHNE